MLTIDETRNLLDSQFPDLKIETINHLGEGWYNSVCIINNEYIFRFPKSKEAAEYLKTEIKLLEVINSELDIEVPIFEFLGQPSNSISYDFVGYKAIKGEFLYTEVLQSYSDKAKENIAKQLARILKKLHSIPKTQLKSCGIYAADFKADYKEWKKEIGNLLFEKLDNIEVLKINNMFDNYLNDPDNFSFTPCLLHSDLSGDHILVGKKSCKINGIIDWGEARFGDPDFDFLPLYKEHGKEFLLKILGYYKHSDLERLFNKLNVFRFYNLVNDLVHEYGEIDKSCIIKVKKLLDEF